MALPNYEKNENEIVNMNNKINEMVKMKTINNAQINAYGNIDLELNQDSAMVLGVKLSNNGCNSIPFINANKWYCYVVKNQAQSVLNLHTSGTVNATIYYMEI